MTEDINDIARVLRNVGAMRLIELYQNSLERAAKEFEQDRADAAHTAIAATISFLFMVDAPCHLIAPFHEAAGIIQEKLGAMDLSPGVVEKVYQSIAVHLQIECEVPEAEALKNVVGKNPGAIKTLKNFRGNMMSKNSPKGARDFYFQTLHRAFKDFSPEERMNRALTICRRMRGKKS
jgi:hypothetical protein